MTSDISSTTCDVENLNKEGCLTLKQRKLFVEGW